MLRKEIPKRRLGSSIKPVTKMVDAHGVATPLDENCLERYDDLPTENDPKGTRCYFYSVSQSIRLQLRFN